MSIKVVFVCLGNICRSPMAEAIFQQMVNEAGLADSIEIDSAGTGSWHVGETAHPGTRRILAKHDIPYNGRARQVTAADMDPDNYVIAMDDSNMRDLKRRFGDHPRLYRLLDFARNSNERNVPDPYYTNNFDYVYQLVSDGCRGLLQTIRDENQL
jgi:protein-tyrosine phosphatase